MTNSAHGDSQAALVRNHAHKEDIRLHWSKRAATFDDFSGHRIEDGAEAPEWQALLTQAFGPLRGRRVRRNIDGSVTLISDNREHYPEERLSSADAEQLRVHGRVF